MYLVPMRVQVLVSKKLKHEPITGIVETAREMKLASASAAHITRRMSKTQQKEYISNETSKLININENNDAVASSDLDKARRLLYLSHFFAQFSEAAWQFALILFLAAFTKYKSLFLISTYGVASGLSICMFGTQAGRFVDGSNRLFAASFFIWTENLSVLIATILCYLLLSLKTITTEAENVVLESLSWTERNFPNGALSPWTIFLLIGIHFWGSLASILDKGFLVAIERDWVVVMSQEVGPLRSAKAQKWLSETNVMMKQIDLSCQIMAPAVAGFVIGAIGDSTQQSASDLAGSALLVGAVNVAALIVEYFCTSRIYHLIPRLAEMPQQAIVLGNADLDFEETNGLKGCAINCQLIKLPPGLKVYMDQSVSWAGIALSLL